MHYGCGLPPDKEIWRKVNFYDRLSIKAQSNAFLQLFYQISDQVEPYIDTQQLFLSGFYDEFQDNI